MGIYRRKSIEESIAATHDAHSSLKRRLGPLDLIVFGIGVIIGAGIFTDGKGAALYAGPAIVISFLIGAACCALAALCYAEFASMVPVSGSAYTYSYATLGEIIAWVIGWDLLLELVLGASVVAQGWSTYFVHFLSKLGIIWPEVLGPTGTVDLAVVILVGGLTFLVAQGIKQSARVNLVLVGVKLFIVCFVVLAGLAYIKLENYVPFIPDPVPAAADPGLAAPLLQAFLGAPTSFGMMGVLAGASIIFFDYIGFDVVATTAEESKDPQRDLPIGIFGSLAVCTVIYIAISLVLTGMVRYDEVNSSAAIASAFERVGNGSFATIISIGAVAGLTSVVMTLIIGSTRVLFSMSRDHLLPPRLSQTSDRTGTPVLLTVIVGGTIAVVASLSPVGNMDELVNMGALFAFTLVAVSVPILRRKRPDLKRPFRVPGSPAVPIAAAVVCFVLMLSLSVDTWLRFIAWTGIGLAIYALYGRRRSRLAVGDRYPTTSGDPDVTSSDVTAPG